MGSLIHQQWTNATPWGLEAQAVLEEKEGRETKGVCY